MALALLLCACAQPPGTPLHQFTLDLDPDVELDGRVVTVPGRFDEPPLPEDRPYRLRTTVELPAADRGRSLDLSIPRYEARVSLFADGRPVPSLDPHGGYRNPRPQRWRIPEAATSDGVLALELVVEHHWTKSGWLMTTPVLLPSEAADPRADVARLVNVYGAWLAFGVLLQLGATCLMVFFLDRRRRPYLWFGIQTISALSYPLFTLELQSDPLGTWDLPVLVIGLLGGLFASLHFTHSYFDLGPVPRWPQVLVGLAAINTVVQTNSYAASTIGARGGVLAVIIIAGYQLVILVRQLRVRTDNRVSIALLLSGWIVLAAGSAGDQLTWFTAYEPLGGVRPGCVSLAFFAVCLSLVLSRSHIRSLARADELNTALAARVEEVEAERTRAEGLNEDLRQKIADRSAQMFAALSLIDSPVEQRQFTLAPGVEIDGRYRIERSLGAGAMGMVYEVTRLSDGSRWAMKVATEVRGAALARLAREANVASKLRHDNVVQIRDIDVASLGFMYLVLELVDGVSLRERVRDQGPLTTAEALPVLIQIARGLAALHEASIAHRDLKPDNVLLTRSEGRMVAKIADFGISRVREVHTTRSVVEPRVEGENAHERETTVLERETTVLERSPSLLDEHGTPSSQELTGTGFLAGTPHYIAPELATGGERADIRADLFSFGIVAFEILAGERPFAVAVATRLLSGELVTDGVVPSLPAAHASLQPVVERCLSFEPSARPTASELVELLEAIPPEGGGADEAASSA